MLVMSILEVAIGIAFIYLFLSLLVTWINEWIAHLFRVRANFLKRAIENLITDIPDYFKDKKKYLKEHKSFQPFINKFYDHPVIRSLGYEKTDKNSGKTHLKHKPSYIPENLFTSVTFNILFKDREEEKTDYVNKTGKELKIIIEKIPYPKAREALLAFWESGAQDIKALCEEVEKWFNCTMQRLSGWYKRKAQLISLIFGFFLAVALNVDTFVLTGALWREPVLRSSVVEYVTTHKDMIISEPDNKIVLKDKIQDIRKQLEAFDMPLGWGEYGPKISKMIIVAKESGQNENVAVLKCWFIKGCGWLITALAVSLGAPFWFDILNKFVNLRSSGLVTSGKSEDKTDKK